MFSVSGDSGDEWHQGTINVDLSAEFDFIFEGKNDQTAQKENQNDLLLPI